MAVFSALHLLFLFQLLTSSLAQVRDAIDRPEFNYSPATSAHCLVSSSPYLIAAYNNTQSIVETVNIRR